MIERRRAGEAFDPPRRELPKNTDAVATVIAEKCGPPTGASRPSAWLPLALAAGYTGSARNFREALMTAALKPFDVIFAFLDALSA